MSKFAVELNRDRRRAEGNTYDWSSMVRSAAKRQNNRFAPARQAGVRTSSQ